MITIEHGITTQLNGKTDKMYVISPHSQPLENNTNPFTLRVPLASIVWYFNTFANNLEIKRKFTKYLKYCCCLASD